jgi:hypothetical protein
MPRRTLAATEPVPVPEQEPAPAPGRRGAPVKEIIPLPEGLAVRDMTPEQKLIHQRNLGLIRSRRCAAKKRAAAALEPVVEPATTPVLNLDIPEFIGGTATRMAITNVVVAMVHLMDTLKVTRTDSATQTDRQEEAPLPEPESEPELAVPHKLRDRKKKKTAAAALLS